MTLRSLAALQEASGQLDAALISRQNLETLEPRHAVDRLKMARLLERMGRRTEAESSLRSALLLEPRYRAAWLQLATLLSGEDPGASAACLREAAALAKSLRLRYCDDERRKCEEHIGAVMSPLEREMVGDFIDEADSHIGGAL